MNKNMVYVALLAVLCTLAGVVVGAVIVKCGTSPWYHPERHGFSEKAECFMRQGLGGPHGESFRGQFGHKMQGRKGGEGLLEMLVTKLELNSDQQAKVKDILDKTRKDIDEVGKNVRTAITEIKEKGDKEIMDILNPAQQEKFKALLEDFKKMHESKRRGGECGPMGRGGHSPDQGFPPPPPQE